MKFRIILAAALMSLTVTGFAKSEFLDFFVSHYKISDSSPLGQKGCLICHASEDDYKLNVYGLDLKMQLAAANASMIDANILKAVGEMDSNGTGKTNEQKILAGQSPGEPGPAVPKAEPKPKPKSLIPKNFFHPAVVHFPIALFIGGLMLDFFGFVFKRKELLLGGWYNIVMGVITSMGGIVTGFGAMWIQKVPFRGVIFQHMILALISVVLMIIMISLRLHKHEKMHLPSRIIYYVLAIACFVLISYAGHLGGAFVYGE